MIPVDNNKFSRWRFVGSVRFRFLCNDPPTGLVESVFGGRDSPLTIIGIGLARFRVGAGGLG